jgi:hypothetical protein
VLIDNNKVRQARQSQGDIPWPHGSRRTASPCSSP